MVKKKGGLDLTGSTTYYTNVDREIISTTKEKLELCLKDNKDFLEKKYSWHTPLGLLVTLITTLIITDLGESQIHFSDKVVTINWGTIYVVALICSLFWLIQAIWFSIKYGKRVSIDKIIQQLQKGKDK